MIRLRPGTPRWVGVAVPVMIAAMATMLGWMLFVSNSGRAFTGTEKTVVVGITLVFLLAYAVTLNTVLNVERPDLPEE